jgi:lipid-binding SYLF domain-containing protein
MNLMRIFLDEGRRIRNGIALNKMKPKYTEIPIVKHTNLNLLLAVLFIAAVSPVFSVAASGDLRADADTAIKNLQRADSTLTNRLCNSAGYAVFPKVGKGGFILGAEHGNGIVYKEGKPIGEATLTEINVGPQVGGVTFYEIIFFETAEALANFKEGHFEMSAKVSAVAAAEGAALNAKYREGVLVITMPRSGLMAQVAIGGQKFKFKPLEPAS